MIFLFFFYRNPVESFWVSASQDGDDGPRSAAMLTQPVALSEEFNPVKWTCRAPMKSGKLCPRKDRFKCPFHGPVVARDELGSPKDPFSVSTRPKKDAVPDWQEPGFLADIKAATGVDLTMPVKGKRKGPKVEFPNLTDIKALKNTSRSRLEKKVFSKWVAGFWHLFFESFVDGGGVRTRDDLVTGRDADH